MKKASIILLCVTAAFLVFMGGFLVGRNANRSPITISRVPNPTAATHQVPTTPSQGLLDINTASHSQLAEIPGIGEVIAQRILDYRQQHGPFTSLSDLTNVEGIGDKRMSTLLEYITLGE